MQLARYLNKLFQKDGFLLIDANSNKYIIGTPKNNKPITVKILDKKLHYKLFFRPDLYLEKLILMEIYKLKMEALLIS